MAKAQEIIRVTNDAMAPQIWPGDILFLERREPYIMVYGLPCVIVLKNNNIYIRRIYFDTGAYFKLVSDNVDKYPNKIINKNEVESIITITKVVRYMSDRIELI